MSKIKKLYTVVALITLLLVPNLGYAQEFPTFADPFACASGYSAMVQLPPGNYEIYALPGEFIEPTFSIKAAGFIDGSCNSVLSTNRVGNNLQRLGEYTVAAPGLAGTIFIESANASGFASASAPTLLFKPKTILLISLYFLLTLIGVSILWWAIRRVYLRYKWKRLHTAGVATGPVDLNSVLIKDNRAHTLKIVKIVALSLSSVVAVFILTTSFFVSSFTVDGLSMFDTLKDRETLPLNKTPVSFAKLNKRDFIPERGQIIVFKHSDNNLFDDSTVKEESYVVKRVLALPGEQVTMVNNVITVYNEDMPQGFNPDENVEWSDKIKPIFYKEKVFNIKVGANELFVAGDNRDESIDSRFYGPIPIDSIVGVVIK
jgi:signal peptidase I